MDELGRMDLADDDSPGAQDIPGAPENRGLGPFDIDL